jgi:predicted transcriptional regulator
MSTINDKQPIHIHIESGSSVGNFVIAHSIADSFNRIESAEVPSDLKQTLQELANAVKAMVASMPKEAAEQVARDLETLTAEAISKTPRQQWWQLSAEGLKKAAKNVGEIGVPVLTLVATVITILSAKP